MFFPRNLKVSLKRTVQPHRILPCVLGRYWGYAGWAGIGGLQEPATISIFKYQWSLMGELILDVITMNKQAVPKPLRIYAYSKESFNRGDISTLAPIPSISMHVLNCLNSGSRKMDPGSWIQSAG